MLKMFHMVQAISNFPMEANILAISRMEKEMGLEPTLTKTEHPIQADLKMISDTVRGYFFSLKRDNISEFSRTANR